MAKKQAKITTSLKLRNPESKLRLTKKVGNKRVSWTLAQAMKPRNFKQLTALSQKAITSGISATQILERIAKEEAETDTPQA